MKRLPSNSPVSPGRRALWLPFITLSFLTGIWVAIAGCGGSDSPSSVDEDGPASSVSGVFMTTTGDDGRATVVNDSGKVVLEAETLDSLGHPIPGLEITYLASEPEPLVAFNDGDGEPVGMFLIGTGAASKGEPVPALSGVFILSLLDPTFGRLYDSGKDDFETGVQNNIETIRSVIDWEDLEVIFAMTPGVTDMGIKRKSELIAMAGNEGFLRSYERSPNDFYLSYYVQRIGIFSLLAANQHDNYRYRYYQYKNNVTSFLIPLGLDVAVQIVEPANGSFFSSTADREQDIWGTLDVPPDVVTSAGGQLKLLVNGAAMGDVLELEGDGQGGTSFSSSALLELPAGETTIEISAYVNETNRGFQSADGYAGSAVSRVRYEGQIEGPFAPVLSGLSHPASYPCPDLDFVISYDFNDPDGDLATIYITQSSSMGGGEWSDPDTLWASIQGSPGIACLQGTSGHCELPLEYEDADGGYGLRYEFWVVDSEGHASNSLFVQADITGDCDPFKRGAEEAFSVTPPRFCP